MIYIYSIGSQNYIGESVQRSDCKDIEELTAVDGLLKPMEYVLLEYGILVEMGNQVGIMHQFSPLYFPSNAVSSIRVICDGHELHKLFTKTRDKARDDDRVRRSGIITADGQTTSPIRKI